ncbi:MAG: TonB family protein [bacterium]
MNKNRLKTAALLSSILVVAVRGFLFAQSDAAKRPISLFFEDKPLREVLQEIARQSNIKFVFSDMLVEGKQIRCDIRNLPIDKTLTQIMTQTDVSFKFLPDELVVLFRENSATPGIRGNLSGTQFTPVLYTEPIVQGEVEPDYPPEARQEGLEGSVDMYLFVNERGEVEQARINQSSGYNILDDASVAFAKRLKFNPAKKEGKPVAVWVSRIMNYQLVDKQFLPGEYIEKIKDLYRLADRSNGEEKKKILHEILWDHEILARYLNGKSNLIYNKYVQEILKEEVYTEWKELWEDWPLHFVVFHDFIVRYPEAEEISTAEIKLQIFMDEDIAHIKKSSINTPDAKYKKQIALKKMVDFLAKKYPHLMTEHMKKEVYDYLAKN